MTIGKIDRETVLPPTKFTGECFSGGMKVCVPISCPFFQEEVKSQLFRRQFHINHHHYIAVKGSFHV